MIRTEIPKFFDERRERLMKAYPGAAFILPSTPEFSRNPDVEYPFRQESSFYYLSGFEEAHSCLVLVPKAGSGFETHLFLRERNPEREMWDGERYGTERAPSIFRVDAAHPITEAARLLPGLLKSTEKVYFRMGFDTEWDRKVVQSLDETRKNQGRMGKSLLPIHDPQSAVGEMRLLKGAEEIGFLREAGKISAQAHIQAMKETRPGMKESDIEALIDYLFRKSGCRRNGYGSIVAGGKNATCLHYRDNNEIMKDGDLLLIDAGGEYEYYTADITRTFPIGRRFSKEQAEIYDLVLRAQKETIAIAKPGLAYTELHKKSSTVLFDGLKSMGFLKGTFEECVKDGSLKRYYPHGTGHYLGMDVHDTGLYLSNLQSTDARKLEAGMCFTVEPGIYFQPSDREAPEKYRGIGIRIEDDILVTPTGTENLTALVPKERTEIEALRAF